MMGMVTVGMTDKTEILGSNIEMRVKNIYHYYNNLF